MPVISQHSTKSTRAEEGKLACAGAELSFPSLTRQRLAIAFWIMAIMLAAVQAWICRYDIVNDTISYMDMGDRFFSGHPSALINGMWSPLDAVLLGAVTHFFKPSMVSEYPAVHLLMLLVFVCALACFEFFLRQLEAFRSRVFVEGNSRKEDLGWIAIAYVVFLWAALDVIGAHETNPDMIVAAFFLLACGFLTRIAAGVGSWRDFAYLGATLGLGYLTKAAMLPIALALLVSAWTVADRQRKQVLLAAGGLILVAAPYIAGLSLQKGRLTVGETGRINYAMHVDMVGYHNWQGDDPTFGTPVHPTRRISRSPQAFEFNGPVPGTYPEWYDPTYWYDGVKIKVNLRQQLRAIKTNLLSEAFQIFFALNSTLFACLFIAFGTSRDKAFVLRNAVKLGFLIMPASFALGLYSLVHYEPRYAGGFLAVLLISVFASIHWSGNLRDRRLVTSMILLQILFLVLYFAPLFNANSGYNAGSSYQAIAAGTEELGLHPGDRIASIDFGNLSAAMWARLAKVQVIAEVYSWPRVNEDNFWYASPAIQEQLLRKFQQLGARAAVTSERPVGPNANHWARIGNTGFYLLWLNAAAGTTDATQSMNTGSQ